MGDEPGTAPVIAFQIPPHPDHVRRLRIETGQAVAAPAEVDASLLDDRRGRSKTVELPGIAGLFDLEHHEVMQYPAALQIDADSREFPPSSVAVVSQIRLPQTTGEDHPRPWMGVFQTTFPVSLHSSGRSFVEAWPFAEGPRNAGHGSDAWRPAVTSMTRLKQRARINSFNLTVGGSALRPVPGQRRSTIDAIDGGPLLSQSGRGIAIPPQSPGSFAAIHCA